MALNYMVKWDVPKNVPFVLEIHNSLFRKWMLDYSVKDFLSGGQIFEHPENFGDPKWASDIANNHYNTQPVKFERLKNFVSGYMYLEDGPDGNMRICHIENVPESNQSVEDV